MTDEEILAAIRAPQTVIEKTIAEFKCSTKEPIDGAELYQEAQPPKLAQYLLPCAKVSLSLDD